MTFFRGSLYVFSTQSYEILKGEDLAKDDLQALIQDIEDLDDELEVEVRDGGQPLYPIQLVAE